MSVNVSLKLDVPRDTFLYDIGGERLICKVCNKAEEYKINEKPSRNGSPSVASRFQSFSEGHGECLLKLRDKRIKQSVSGPCRQDYRDANGRGPHECGKAIGHSGPCGR